MEAATVEYRGYTLRINYDEADDNPINWTTPDDRGATYALYHKRYDLPFEIDNAGDLDEYESWTEFAQSNALSNQPIYKFVRWFEHSGISVSLRDDEDGHGWDAGIAGVIFGESEDAIESTFWEFKHYTEGDIYSVTVEDQHGEFVDSLGCIFGTNQAQAEGMAIVDYALSLPRAGHHPIKASALHN